MVTTPVSDSRPAIVSDCFSRNLGSITADQQQRLLRATVAVIGCGGLGGFVIEELARLGIGSLHICDPDRFEPGNCNRQLYADRASLGKNKAETAARRVSSIHDHCRVHAHGDNFQNVEHTLFAAADVVVDCLDELRARRELAGLCRKKNLPLVHGAVEQWYGQVAVQLPGNNNVDNLIQGMTRGEKHGRPPSVLVSTVATVASLQAAEVCKLLLDLPSPLSKSWLSIDLKRMTFDLG